MRAVIPVAGVGTRLRPHTYALPKVLLNVAGKPILAHILDALVEHEVKHVTIITGYMGELVEEFVRKRYKNIDVEFIEQKERLGLGHAIWVGKSTYRSNEPLMIVLGDTVFDVDLSIAFAAKANAIGVKEVDDPRRFGVVVMNGDGTINKFVEKPETLISKLAIVGMYYIQNPELLIDSLDKLIKNKMVTRGEYQLTDALQLMLTAGEKFTTFPVDGWYDCGKPETLLSTNRFLLEKHPAHRELKNSVIIPPCFISDEAVVENSIVGPYTSIADGAIVKDSVVRHSIISYESKVIQTLLTDSIIGNEAEVIGKYSKYNVGNSSVIELE